MKKNLHIFISSLRGGGAERVCTTLANELVKKDFNINLVTINLDSSIFDKELDGSINLINFNKKHARQAFFDLKRYIEEYKPEKILVFTPQIAIILVLIRLITRNEYIIVARNINTLSLENKNQKSFWHKYIVHFCIKFLYHKVDRVIAQSQGMCEDLVTNYGFKSDKVTVIHNPVSPKIAKAQEDDDGLLQVRNGDNLLFVGRLSKQKGISFLLQAMAKLVKERPDTTLYIVGEGPLKQKLEHLCKELDIQDKVTFKGFTNNVGKYYYRANATVLTSLYEGFPNVLVESIMAGTPIVAFDCKSGPSEIIQDSKNGFLVKYLDVEDLKEKLIKALEYNWDKNLIRATAREFSVGQVIEKYIDVLGD